MGRNNKNSEAKKFLLVFNNEAGKGCSDHKKDIVIRYLDKNNCDYKIISTDDLVLENDLRLYDAVVAVGGDGTVLRTIPMLANTDIKLGIIPCGTANLFAASLCIPSNIHKAIDILIHGSTSKVDIGRVGEEYFALRVGIGYDAEVVNSTKRCWKKRFGYLAYLIQGIISCFKLSSKSYRVTIDNKSFEVDANAIIVSNTGNMFKNMFSVAPFGSLNDGKLDIFIVLARNFWEFMTVLLEVLIGKHCFNSKVIYGQAQNIKIQSSSKNIHIDGEPFLRQDIDISIIPNALMVVVP